MRATLDKLISWTGLLMALVLLVAGVLLLWASSFAHDQVKTQLTDQHITMPEGDALETQAQKDALEQYAGEKMTTGAQAKAYADHYILVHMNAASGGKTYSEVSGEYMAMSSDPNADQAKVEELGQLRQTMFMGSTLRGLLLNAYAFDTLASIAFWASIASFIGAALLAVLGVFGLRHAREVARAEA
ncbi:MAG TPA: hypothetical protein PLP61_12875 [Nocardioides sp.]|uniref:hypothetical protein n=1 Tax=Nocardioides sp. TaxID=35761 RepID=UPI002BF93F46|nr:hypothetical protein [Nocardioides sp.]HQR27925.1 hypothetical protein [Nocardioides sp.]